MKKTLSYLTIVISSLLQFSCSNEEVISSTNGELIEMPVSIEIAGNSQSQLETKAEVDLSGTCDADKVLLLVYSGPTSITDRRNLTYHSQQILNCENLESNKKKAYGTITGTANTHYSIFAIAYNSTYANFEVLTSEGAAMTTATTYGNTRVTLKTTMEGTLNRYQTPEIFVGNVMPQGVKTEVFAAEGEAHLTRTLYRAVGKGKFTITNIPSTIKKISWLTEKLATYNILYRENDGATFSKYPMGIPSETELRKELNVVDVKENIGDTEWTAELESFFIPLKESLFYIDATDENDNTTRYLVKCADKIEDSIWVYVLGYGVESYRFSIPPNYQIIISGTFGQLQNSGNIHIDLSAIEDVDGGFLPGGKI